MRVKGQRVSRQKDSVTFCRPSAGYDDNAMQIELEQFDEVASVYGELPESDEQWPKGAPLQDHVKVGEKILRKKGR